VLVFDGRGETIINKENDRKRIERWLVLGILSSDCRLFHNDENCRYYKSGISRRIYFLRVRLWRRWSWHHIRFFLVRIRSMTCVNFLVACVRCRLWFSIEWCQFRWESSSKKWSLGRKTRFSPIFLYIKILYFLSGFALWPVLSLKMVVLGSEFNSLSNDVSFEWGHRGKKIGTPSRYKNKTFLSDINDGGD
jgi:hypothetical protein